MKVKSTDLPREESRRNIEKRRSPRRLCAGDVHLISDDVRGRSFRGTLYDISKTGFRAIHGALDLSAGNTVQFKHPFGKGTAKVAWTRILGKQAESGFFVMEAAAGSSSP